MVDSVRATLLRQAGGDSNLMSDIARVLGMAFLQAGPDWPGLQPHLAFDVYRTGAFPSAPVAAELGNLRMSIRDRSTAFQALRNRPPDSAIAYAAMATVCQLASWSSAYPPSEKYLGEVSSDLSYVLSVEGTNLLRDLVEWMTLHREVLESHALCATSAACFGESSLVHAWVARYMLNGE
jgi:hypothetical protein